MAKDRIERFEIEYDAAYGDYWLIGHGTRKSGVLKGAPLFVRLSSGTKAKMIAKAKEMKKSAAAEHRHPASHAGAEYAVLKGASIDVLDEDYAAMKPEMSGWLNALPGPDDPVPGGMYPDDW